MSEIREWEEGEEAAYVEVAELLFGESEYTPENVANGVRQLLCEMDSLRDWQAGAMAAAWISYPAGVPPHTEAVYCAHKADYVSRSEHYRLGADEVAAAILSVKERLGCLDGIFLAPNRGLEMEFAMSESTDDAVDSGSKDSAPMGGDGERS